MSDTGDDPPALDADLGARIRTDAVSGGLAFSHDADSLARSQIWNLTCPFGDFDLSFRPSGTDGFDDLARAARSVRLGDQELPIASLADIIRSKQAAGRPKDILVLPVLYDALDRNSGGKRLDAEKAATGPRPILAFETLAFLFDREVPPP